MNAGRRAVGVAGEREGAGGLMKVDPTGDALLEEELAKTEGVSGC